jgi:hypothetical protein
MSKIPRWKKPKTYKDEDHPDLDPPYSSRMFCGECGAAIPPEYYSVMSCHNNHDLELVGIYQVGEKDGTIHEGWMLRP